MNPLTKEQENRRMLAMILGVDEAEAAERLAAVVLVTHADDEVSLRIAKQVNDMLTRTVNATRSGTAASEAVVEVLVGDAQPRAPKAAQVWVGSTREGILVSTDRFRMIDGTEHAIFGLIAACYACGMALRHALGSGLALAGHNRILVSPRDLLGNDLACLDMSCELGDAVLAGAGAVGNGLLYGLQHFNVSGTLYVVDPKDVHDGALNRCIWFTLDDLQRKKAEAIVERAQAAFPRLTLVPRPVTIKEFYRSQEAPPLTRLITTVDSRRARRGLQGEIPREVYDASTTAITEVVVHFNEQPSQYACLSCIYKQESGELAHEAHVAEVLGVSLEDVRKGFIDVHAASKIARLDVDLKPEELVGKAYDTLFKARCAQGKLRTAEDRQVLAPFCMVSMLAGAFLALEFVRRLNTGLIAEPFNYWRVSPWHSPVIALRSMRKRLADCEFCSEPTTREVIRGIWCESA
jgi:hypothetical protein